MAPVFCGSLLHSGFMLKKPALQQEKLELVSIGVLVPDRHSLPKVDQTVERNFADSKHKNEPHQKMMGFVNGLRGRDFE